MPSSGANQYYIPLATSPSLAQSPLLDDEESARPSASPHSTRLAPSRWSCFAGGYSTRSSLLSSRRALLVAGLVSLLTLIVVSSVLERRNLSARVEQVVNKGHKAVDAVWEAGAELRESTTGFFSSDEAAAGPGAVPFAGEDFIASQADTGSPPAAAKAQDDGSAGSSATPGNPDMLDHALLSEPPVNTAAQAVCTPEMQARVNNAIFWTVKQDEPLRYSIAAAQDSSLSDPLPPSCLAHAVFSAQLVSLAPTAGEDENDRLDPPESQTLVALERPVWQSESSSYELRIPEMPTLPSRRYELEVRLEFGYYPGLEEGVPCGAEAATCSPHGILATAEGGQGDLRYLGDKVAVASGATLDLPDREVAKDESVPRCTDLSSLTGYWSNLSYYPASPACSLAIPTLPLPDALFAPAGANSTSSSPPPPLWINIVGDSNSRNAYKRFIDSLGGGFHASGPMVMDSKTHNGTLAGLAFRYRDGVPPADETKQVPDLVVTWMWWYQVAQQSGGDELAQNRDELLSFVDTDLAAFLTTAKLDSTHEHLPLLRDAARGVRPHRTYLSLGSHGEELSVPGVAASLDALLSETDGLSRLRRDAANLRLVTTTLVNTRHIPLARFPHQDLVRTNALIHAKNVYAAGHRPEFAREGRVLDVEALTRGIVEQDEWMKQSGKRGADAVHFRTDVYDEWVRVLWTDLLSGASQQPDSNRVATTSEARKRWKRRSQLEDETF